MDFLPFSPAVGMRVMVLEVMMVPAPVANSPLFACLSPFLFSPFSLFFHVCRHRGRCFHFVRGEGQKGCASMGTAPLARWEVFDKVFGGSCYLVLLFVVDYFFGWCFGFLLYNF